jgi:hypothetical protein
MEQPSPRGAPMQDYRSRYEASFETRGLYDRRYEGSSETRGQYNRLGGY